NYTPHTNTYTLSLHDALPISTGRKTPPNKSDVQFLSRLYLHVVSTIVVPMSGETLNPIAPPLMATRSARLPKSLLYSIFARIGRSEEHTSELQSLAYLVCRLL